jgi:dynein heavy chain
LFDFTKDETKKSLGVEFNILFQHLDVKATGTITEDNLRSLICCDFPDPKNDSKPYVEVTDLNNLRKVVEGYLDEFNNMSKKPMNLVLFR